MTFNVGDKIRRCCSAVRGAPIGFETVVIEPELGTGAGADRVWYTNKYGEEVHGDVDVFELITPSSPIRTETVTVRRLEPGVYGLLGVAQGEYPDRQVRLSLQGKLGDVYHRDFDAAELRELARVALEIAEYLDAQ